MNATYLDMAARSAADRALEKLTMLGVPSDGSQALGAALECIGVHLIEVDERYVRRFHQLPFYSGAPRARHVRLGLRAAFFKIARP